MVDSCGQMFQALPLVGTVGFPISRQVEVTVGEIGTLSRDAEKAEGATTVGLALEYTVVCAPTSVPRMTSEPTWERTVNG